jgi:hypothetical protein
MAILALMHLIILGSIHPTSDDVGFIAAEISAAGELLGVLRPDNLYFHG